MPGRAQQNGTRAKIALTAWLVVVGPAAIHAEDLIPLTLSSALERADRDSPELASARERAAAQSERAVAAGRSTWPRLVVTSEWVHTDTPARVFADRLNRGEFTADDFALDHLNHPEGISHLVTGLALEVPVDVFGRARSRTEAERATARALEAAAQEARQDLRLRVVEAFEGAVLAKAAVRVEENALDGARSRESDLAARVEQGAALHADWLRARARRRQREAELAAAREQGSITVAALARAIGAPPGAPLIPAGSPLPPAEGTLDEWRERALAGRSALAAAKQRRAAAGENLLGERRSLLPDIGISAQLQDDRGASASARSYAVGASLRWSLLDPARGRRVAAASAEVRGAEADARSATDQVALEVETAWRRLLSARERHEAARGGAEEGREALRVVQERRRAGMATLTDELETETAAMSAELEELSTAAQVVIAEAALRRSAGGL
jgi:outer membrane protein TolC